MTIKALTRSFIKDRCLHGSLSVTVDALTRAKEILPSSVQYWFCNGSSSTLQLALGPLEASMPTNECELDQDDDAQVRFLPQPISTLMLPQSKAKRPKLAAFDEALSFDPGNDAASES